MPAPCFKHILPDGFSTFIPRSEAEKALVSGDSLSRAKLRSRLGRILNLARAPYALTLFLDDDTFACLPTHGATGVRGALRALQSRAGMKAYRHYDIRAHTFAKHRREKIALRDAHECAWALAKDGSRLGAGLEAHCYDAMQGADSASVSDLFRRCEVALPHRLDAVDAAVREPRRGRHGSTQARRSAAASRAGRWP